MDIELIRSNIDAAMGLINNNSYGATSLKNQVIATRKLQEALDETYSDGDKYKSRACGRHKHRVALFCEECMEEYRAELMPNNEIR